MKKTANARFAIQNWDEKSYSEGQDLPRLARASVTKTFTGDIEGEGQVEYLMMYRSDGSAAFVGLERVTGRIGGMSGTFVLQRIGVFESGQAKESYSVVPGSATGELSGLHGDGSSAVGHGSEHPFTLDYDLAQQGNGLASGSASMSYDRRGAASASSQGTPPRHPRRRCECDRRIARAPAGGERYHASIFVSRESLRLIEARGGGR